MEGRKKNVTLYLFFVPITDSDCEMHRELRLLRHVARTRTEQSKTKYKIYNVA